MAIVVNGTGQNNVSGQSAASFVFLLIDHLRNNSSWTVAGSSNATSGGMGSDFITAIADLANTNSWVVMESPDSSLQILFDFTANALACNILVNPAADYTGGSSSTLPTSAAHPTNGISFWATNISDAVNKRVHVACDDSVSGTPYWMVWEHTLGNFTTSEALLAFLPLQNGDAGDTRPYVFLFNRAALSAANCASESAASGGNYGFQGFRPGTTTWTSCPALEPSTGSGFVWPGDAPTEIGTGNDLLLPAVHAKRASTGTGSYRGVSVNHFWAGTARTQADTYGTQAYIHLGALAFSWDGATTPTSS